MKQMMESNKTYEVNPKRSWQMLTVQSTVNKVSTQEERILQNCWHTCFNAVDG